MSLSINGYPDRGLIMSTVSELSSSQGSKAEAQLPTSFTSLEPLVPTHVTVTWLWRNATARRDSSLLQILDFKSGMVKKHHHKHELGSIALVSYFSLITYTAFPKNFIIYNTSPYLPNNMKFGEHNTWIENGV